MSIIITDDTVSFHSNVFLSTNPWFDLWVQNKLNNQLHSNMFRSRVSDILDEKFPSMLRTHSSHVFDDLINSGRSRLSNHTASCVEQVNNATNTQVKLLVESKDFDILNNRIFSAVMEKNIAAEADRNARLTTVEKELSSVKSNQAITFLGGSILGLGIGLFLRTSI